MSVPGCLDPVGQCRGACLERRLAGRCGLAQSLRAANRRRQGAVWHRRRQRVLKSLLVDADRKPAIYVDCRYLVAQLPIVVILIALLEGKDATGCLLTAR